jgi:acyl-CoA reductase-like NAD-dependent aldehyde dehydrogenase
MLDRVAHSAAAVARGVEAALSRELVRAGAALQGAGNALADGRPTERACAATGDAVAASAAWFDSQGEALQGAVVAAGILLSMLSFVFGMPHVMTWALGGDPILPPVPLPSAQVVTDDEYAKLFPAADAEPLLRAEDPGGAIEAISPGTGESLGWVPADSPASVRRKVAAARAAQAAFAKTSFAQRRALLNVLRAYMLEEQHDLCALSAIDTGKTLLDASLGEILTTLEKLRWVAAEGEAALSPERRSTGPATMHKAATVEYAPLGVIGAIAPWNYPVHNLLNPVISSLFAGNAVVVKPSEHTVYSSVYLARIVRRALVICGLAPDLMQVLVGGADIGAALVASDIDKLFFTGSTAVGKHVALDAAKRLLPVVLELGGKDAFIICDDADVAHAASMCLRGTFQNAGQNCIGVERVFVHTAVKDAVVARFAEAAGAIRLGVDMGALTMGPAAVAKVQELVDDAVAAGAKVAAGGHAGGAEGMHAGGSYFEATVLTGVRPDMRIAREEVFGPVLSVLEWSSDAELVAAVNDSSFGLGSSVFTGCAKRGSRIFAALRVGMGSVNDYGVHYLCQSLPFGGTKDSGSDRFAGIEGLRGCCLVKSVVRDRFPGIKTTLPPHFKYPVYDNAFALASELNDLMYRPGVVAKTDNLRNVVGMLLSRTWAPRSAGSR